MASSKLPPLKPCPFCGGEAARRDHPWNGKRAYWVDCRTCCSRSAVMKTRRGADNRWNKREGES